MPVYKVQQTITYEIHIIADNKEEAEEEAKCTSLGDFEPIYHLTKDGGYYKITIARKVKLQ